MNLSLTTNSIDYHFKGNVTTSSVELFKDFKLEVYEEQEQK